MNLYLVQHGKAVSEDVDPDRPLSKEGEVETQLIAELAAKLGLQIDEIRHSGKNRAEQTAVIFARALGLMGKVVESSGLGPTDDVAPVAEDVAHTSRSIMIVGHKPFLPNLASMLLRGETEEKPVEFYNSGIVCMEHHHDMWEVKWKLIPGEETSRPEGLEA